MSWKVILVMIFELVAPEKKKEGKKEKRVTRLFGQLLFTVCFAHDKFVAGKH